MFTTVATRTSTVVIEKFAVVLPAGTVTLLGTEAINGNELERETTAPPDGAAPLSVTVPCREMPPMMLAEPKPTDDKVIAGGGTVTERLALLVTPEYTPEIETLVVAPSVEEVLTLNVAVVWPLGTVTLAGTEATAVFALCKDTTIPPPGAAEDSVTVP